MAAVSARAGVTNFQPIAATAAMWLAAARINSLTLVVTASGFAPVGATSFQPTAATAAMLPVAARINFRTSAAMGAEYVQEVDTNFRPTAVMAATSPVVVNMLSLPKAATATSPVTAAVTADPHISGKFPTRQQSIFRCGAAFFGNVREIKALFNSGMAIAQP